MTTQNLRRDAGMPANAIDNGATTPDVAPRRRRWPRRLRRVAVWTLGVVVSLTLVTSTLVVWTVRRSFPRTEGTLPLAGLSAPVTVYRDGYGVPQIYATTEADLFMAQGYVHAQDRFWEMDFRRHLTAGRLSELFGGAMVANDTFLRTLGWRRVAEQEWARLAPEAKGFLEAYATGVNAWIQANGGAEADGRKSLEYAVLGWTNGGYTVRSWDPVDSLAWFKAMAWDLRANMDLEASRATLLAEGVTRDRIDELFPPYPYDRHRPIVDGSASPAAPVHPATAEGAWREAAPALRAVSERVEALSGMLDQAGAGIGSNSWVIAGSLTESGKPLLANDPHLAASMPGIWYQVGLHCSCRYEVTGFSLAGVPGVVIGHNGRVAWGLTNLGPDVTDLYLEKLDGDRYFDGAGWRPLETRREVIEVAGGSPVEITVRATRHGPLLSDRIGDLLAVAARPPLDPSGAPLPSRAAQPPPTLHATASGVPETAAAIPYGVALRWTALDPGTTMEALFAINRATDWAEFRAGAELFDVPSQNLVYADVDGNIGYQAPGRIPVRGKGDGSWPAPGWDPAYDWTGYIPFAELPAAVNPPSGMIVTANQAVVGPEYRYPITRDWVQGYRSQRIHELLAERTATGKLKLSDQREIQFDNRNGFAPTLVPALLVTPLGPGDGPVAQARALLDGWDFQQPAENPAASAAAAAFYNATWRALQRRTLDEIPTSLRPGEERAWEVFRGLVADPASPWWDDRTTGTVESRDDILAAAMRDATAELTDRLGERPGDWRWGELHTITLTSDTLGRSGIPAVEQLFNRGPYPVSGGGGIVNATGWLTTVGYETVFVPSMRMIIDMSDLDASRWIQLSGNSGHAFHRNYDDQVDLWRTGQDLPMRWSRPAVEGAAEHTLTLEPAGR